MSSIKLSVTIGAALRAKYSDESLAHIEKGIAAWIAADRARGITTAHVALDDTAAMKKLGFAALAGRATPAKIKRKLDALCRKLQPDYVLLFGSQQIVPMFVVPNPSYDPGGDDDREVPTDNPYACSTAYKAGTRASYLVPDRVLGRIPDLTGDSDPDWLLDYLQRATAWSPKPASFYASSFAVVCDAWKEAGQACMQALGLPLKALQVSPPAIDAGARKSYGRSLHMIKCHGAELDARFYGQKGATYPEVLLSSSLQSRITEGTLAAAMCCYGAQVFSPADPAAQLRGAWPIASTYLRQGAVGFAGATKIAWVGVQEMMCADWIVTGYLKSALGGASLGRALLEAKQDYVKWLANQGQQPDTADEKTLIEFVLLGDPSLHPVATQATPAVTRAALATTRGGAPARPSPLLEQERSQRRAQRVVAATQIRKTLPERLPAKAPAGLAKRLFDAVSELLDKSDLAALQSAKATAQRLLSGKPQAASAAVTRSGPARAAVTAAPRESLEYYWTGRSQPHGKLQQPQIRLLKVETDTAGNIVRTRLLHSA